MNQKTITKIVLLLTLLLTVGAFIIPAPAEAQGATTIKINFQAETAPVPTGYLRDFGESYGLRTGASQGSGFSYGWVLESNFNTPQSIVGNGRDRNVNADQRLDTLMHMQGNTITGFNGVAVASAWKIAVANGTYTVTVSAGDASNVDSTHRINVEGQTVINNFVPTTGTPFQSGTATVTVTDGFVNVDAIGGTNTKINYIDIVPAGSGAQQPYITGTSPANGAVNIPLDAFISVEVFLPAATDAGILQSSVNTNTVQLVKTSTNTQVAGNRTVSGGRDTFSFTPTALLEPNTQYTFIVTSGVTNGDGVAFLPYTMSFTTGTNSAGGNGTVEFEQIQVDSGANYSSLTFGPDGKLYGLTIDGAIHRWNVNSSTGLLTNKQVITTLTAAYGGSPRLAIGMAFDLSSTANNLVVWVTHSSFGFSGMPDWDGNLSRLSGANLETHKLFVTGFPRSIRDHLTNSIAVHPSTGKLYITQGSMSAMGAPDNAWGNRPEHALSAAVLEVDIPGVVAAVGGEANLPLNVRTESPGTYNPFAAGAPVSVFASGVRNAYDLVWHTNGELYVPTNGSAAGGNTPGNTPGTPDVLPAICQNRINGQPYNGAVVPAINNVNQTQPDFLFRAVRGGFYGHPNPTRCEWAMNGANPTSGSDPAQVNQYPVGTNPDANWRGFAFNFVNNKSPNGVIEYRSGTFNGALQGKILVVRYSGGDDIIVLTPGGANNDIVDSQVGIAGFTGFSDPLELTENPANGHIYVSEYGNGTLTLVRPIGGSSTTNPQIVVNPAELYFDDVSGGAASSTQAVILQNTGTGVLSVTGLALGGTNANQFQITNLPSLPLTINANSTFQLNIAFNPTSTGAKFATLTVTSNATNGTTKTVALAGLGEQGVGGTSEPSLQWILDTYRIPVNAGDTNASTNVIDLPAGKTYNDLIGEEVRVTSFRRASDGNVTVQPIAVYGPTSNNPVVAVGYYLTGNAASTTELFTVSNSPAGNGQTITPPISSGVTFFDPGTQTFGFYSRWPAFSNRQLFSEDGLNTFSSAIPHHVRVYQLKSSTGAVVPNAYIVATEEHISGFDYNDVVLIVRNVEPAQTNNEPPSGAIQVLNLDWINVNMTQNPQLAYLHRWVSLQRINSGTTYHKWHNQGVLRITNTSATQPLVITSLPVSTNKFTVSLPTGVTLPHSIPANGTLDITVTFVENTGSKGVRSATLTINSSATNEPTILVQLRGGYMSGPEGGNEFTVDHVHDLFGFEADSQARNLDPVGNSTYQARLEEVLSSYWGRANASQPIYIRKLLAMHGPGPSDMAVNYYNNGVVNLGGTGSSNDWHQSILPFEDNAGTIKSEELITNVSWPLFWIEVAGFATSRCDGVTNCTQHGTRLFPLYVNGQLVPNSYLVIMDYINGFTGTGSGNYDWNDNQFIITNIQPYSDTTRPVAWSVTVNPQATTGTLNTNFLVNMAVRNTSIFQATNSVFTSTLPTGLTFVSATYQDAAGATQNCTYNGTSRLLTCNFGTVVGAGLRTIALTVRATSAGQATFAGTINSTSPTATANGSAVVNFTNEIPNNPPVIGVVDNQAVVGGNTLSFNFPVTDADNDVLTINVTSSPDASAFTTVTPSGTPGNYNVTIAFAPENNITGTFNFTISADDGKALPVTELFTLNVTGAPVVACAPISTLTCAQVPVAIPYVLNFNSAAGGLGDNAGVGTGFTMVDPPSQAVFLPTGTTRDDVTNAPGYSSDLLTVTGGQLVVRTTKGIQYVRPSGAGTTSTNTNSLLNGLGVGFDADTGAVYIEAKVVNLNFNQSNTTNNSQQAGIWFGTNEDNYVKLVVIRSGAGQEGAVQLATEQLSAGTMVVDLTAQTPSIGNVSGIIVWLRMVANPTDNTVQGFYSTNGTTWLPVQGATGGNTRTVPAAFFAGVNHDNNATSAPISYAGVFATHRNASLDQFIDVKFDDFSITYVNPPVVTYTINASAGANGSITPSGAVTVNSGANQAFTITPNSGYQVDDVLVDGVSVGAVTSYTFNNVTANRTIAATFEPVPVIPPTLTIVKDAQPNAAQAFSFTVTGQAQPVVLTDNGGTNSSTLTLTPGTFVVTEQQAAGWYLTGIACVDNATQLPVGTTDLEGFYANVTLASDQDVTCTFTNEQVPPTTYTVVASAGANGSITPSGSVTVTEGTNQAFTITPASGYQVADVLVDGVSAGAVTSYTFTNVTANHTIEASFSAIPVVACTPISTLPCSQVPVAVPFLLDWNANEGDLNDANGVGTGFTMIDPPSARLTADNPVFNAQVPGYEPSRLNVNTANGTLVISATKGINYRDPVVSSNTNSQINALGVGFNATSAVIIETTVINPGFNLSSGNSSQQAGIWFGLNENNYVKLVVAKTGTTTGKIQLVVEPYGSATTSTVVPLELNTANVGGANITNQTVYLRLIVDPVAGTAAGYYSFNGVDYTQVQQNGVLTLAVPAAFFTGADHDANAGTNAVSYAGVFTTLRNAAATPTIPFAFGKFSINYVNPPVVTYTINATAGANGSITPSGAVTVNSGASQVFTITPANGYQVSDVLVNGVSVGAVTSYTFNNVTANQTISASFAVIPPVTYTINATAGANGSITPSGAVTVNSGASQAFTITPASGYQVSDVLVNGVSVGAVTSYTFNNVTSNQTISASFSAVAPTTYTINATAGANGSITPNGAVTVNSGASQAFTIAPANGYQVSDVLVNGASVGAVTSYTFNNVTSNQTISASFAVIPPVTADVAIDKLAPTSAAFGVAFDYTVRISNAGPAAATNIVVTDTLPSGVTVNSISGSGATCANNNGVITCTLASLNSGDTLDIVINVTPDSTSQFYSLRAVNDAPFAVPSLSLTHTLPAGMTFVGVEPAANCAHNAGTITCGFGAANAGETKTVTVEVAAQTQITLVNLATVSAANDSTSNNNEDTTNTNVAPQAQNSAPQVNTGADQSVTLSSGTAAVTLDALVTDDGLPSGTLSYLWSVVGVNAANVSIVSATAEDTQVSFNAAGVYTLKLVANDSALTGEDTVVITVTDEGQPTFALRINAGGQALTMDGVAWSADQYASGGMTGVLDNVITRADNSGSYAIGTPNIYISERAASANNLGFGYSIPVQNGTYTVRLHFAEIYWTGQPGYGPGGAGRRIFSANIEGQSVLANYDITAEVGGLRAVVKQFTANVTDGTLNIDFPPGTVDRPKLSGIEVLRIGAPVNAAPVANAGSDITVFDNDNNSTQSVNLAGTATDDGLPSATLTYNWAWSEFGTPKTATGQNVAVNFPVGSFVVTLTVSDGQLSSSDTVTVTVNAGGGSTAPIANAGPDQVVGSPSGSPVTVTLNGTGSIDNVGIVSYAWSLAGFSIPNGATPQVTLPLGDHLITLTVTDGDTQTSTDTVLVRVLQNGFTAEYFNNGDLTNLGLTQIDTVISYNYGYGSPTGPWEAPGVIASETFSVRWTGQIQPQYSGQYTFYVTADDGVRLWVNDQLIINNWTLNPSPDQHAPTPVENVGTITLNAGQLVNIRLEYFEAYYQARVRLEWAHSSQPRQVIPTNRMFDSYAGAVVTLLGAPVIVPPPSEQAPPAAPQDSQLMVEVTPEATPEAAPESAPSEQAPAEQPPVEQPPVEQPPAEQPPVEQPPAETTEQP